MPFRKGQSGNIKGRKNGTPNKVTQLHREFIQSLLDSQQDKIKTELSGLHGKDYLTVINGFMEFVMPKLQRTELKTNEEDNAVCVPPVFIIQRPRYSRPIRESED